MNKYSFAIGIPTINRYDLLEPTLEVYKEAFRDTNIYIIDNGRQGIPDESNIIVSRPVENIGVAASWNRLCDSIFNNYDYALIMNDDIRYHCDQDYIQKRIKGMKRLIAISEFNWSIFIIEKKTYQAIGPFDEQFYPAYFEDNDYHRRACLAGYIPQTCFWLNPMGYNESMSIKKDPKLNEKFMENRDKYVKKWGGLPGQEIFSTPYNK